MRIQGSSSFALLALLLSAAACSENDPAVTGGDPGGSGGSATTTSTGSGSSSGTTSTGTGTGTGGAPPCTATTLADSVRVTTVSIAGAAASRAVTAQAGAASFVAWAGMDGMVHATPLDAADERAGADLVVEGTQVYGAAATAGDVALLVSRAPDRMTFVHVDSGGALLGSSDLVGGGDHAVEGTEWFGEFATTGRLVATGDGTYAAYHALHRRWPDGIGHQGDTLRLLDGAGAPVGGGWDWGCSHSMDQRVSFFPGPGLVPVCIADCYPGKGIYFDHSAAELTPDPQANCAGGYSTLLGGLVATGVYSGVVAPGFFLVYQDAQGGAHLARFDASGGSVSERSLTVAGSSRLARYDGGLLLGYDAGGGATVQQLDDSGDEVGSPAPVPAPLPDQDFEGRDDGEVAWATASGSTLTVVRVRACP